MDTEVDALDVDVEAFVEVLFRYLQGWLPQICQLQCPRGFVSGRLRTLLRCVVPALFTRQSIGPKASLVA